MAVLRPTVATIHLDALEHNLRQLKAELKTGILAVVKANAYGHGVEWVAPALEAAGVDLFGVALIEEGLELRRLGIKTDILVMAGSFIRGEALCIEQRLTPMIGSLATLRAFDQAAAAQRTVLPIHLELDTGIHRLGFLEDDWPALFAELKNFRHLQVVGLASHFANADEPDSAYNAAQFARFSEALGELRLAKIDPPKWLHLSNSAAGLSHPAARYNLVRPGLTLYGYSPFTGASKLALLPILEWSTEIVAIHELSAGQPVSYGGHFVTTRPSRIATLAVGYADGYRRALGNRAAVIIRGQRVPVVGMVCMDLCMADVSDVADAAVGDRVLLIGQSGQVAVSAEELADLSGTISYEILTGITARVPRRAVRGG